MMEKSGQELNLYEYKKFKLFFALLLMTVVTNDSCICLFNTILYTMVSNTL